MSSLSGIELRHLRYFVAVAEELSFTRAAARLHTAQPSFSQQMRQLERSVGVKLLDRSRHHVALTNAGRIFLRQARDILGRVEHAQRLSRQAADGHVGDLSVGTFPSADVRILPPLRPLLAQHLPDLRLILHSKYAVEPLAGLQTGTLDVAFVRDPLDADTGLEIVELLREEIVMVLPSHHALARRKKVPVKRLDDLPCITMERSLSPALHDATLREVLEFAAADAQEALRLIRRNASEWRVDPARVGIIGFSAGGGVAVGAALARADASPDFLISLYRPSLMDVHVPDHAPPLFIAVGSTHFNVTNGCLALFAAWKAAGKPAEIHVYDQVGAGFGMSQRGLPVDTWTDRLYEWMLARGITSVPDARSRQD